MLALARRGFLLAALPLLLGCGGPQDGPGTGQPAAPSLAETPSAALPRVGRPPPGKLYHGFYFSTTDGHEHGVTPADVAAYEEAVGKRVAWVYSSHNWFEGKRFPAARCRWIRNLGKAPYLRLMLWSREFDPPDPVYTLRAIIAGRFDDDLRQWARDAKAFGTPLIVEYGTECNGSWFPWNGKWNGGAQTGGFGSPAKPDGPERFVAAFRRIVNLMRAEGATNITWVWHADCEDYPEAAWNRLENYYPGGAYVDWIGVSVYGPQTPTDEWGEAFRPRLDRAYPRLQALAPAKPIIVAEFACSLRHYRFAADAWAQAALSSLFSGRWPQVAGFCWWNETWENDDNPAHDTDMVIMHDPNLTKVFKTQLETNKAKLQQTPVLLTAGQ